LAYDRGSDHLLATNVTAIAIAGKTAWFAGFGNDKRPFLAYAEDNGAGSRDVFKLWIAGVQQINTTGLAAGDIAILASK
jgi:hypothetical protein